MGSPLPSLRHRSSPIQCFRAQGSTEATELRSNTYVTDPPLLPTACSPRLLVPTSMVPGAQAGGLEPRTSSLNLGSVVDQ